MSHILMLVTVSPVVLSNRPVLEAMMPFPTPEITPIADSSALFDPSKMPSIHVTQPHVHVEWSRIPQTSRYQHVFHLGGRWRMSCLREVSILEGVARCLYARCDALVEESEEGRKKQFER